MRRALALPGLLGLLACGGEAPAPEAGGLEEPESVTVAAAESSARPIVRILEPLDGAVVGPALTVRLEAEGIEIRAVADGVPGTGHHHLFLDTDLTPPGQVIPSNDPGIVHKGDGTSEHRFEGLAPGPHRIIALIADPMHVPLDPPVADTVEFTVGG